MISTNYMQTSKVCYIVSVSCIYKINRDRKNGVNSVIAPALMIGHTCTIESTIAADIIIM